MICVCLFSGLQILGKLEQACIVCLLSPSRLADLFHKLQQVGAKKGLV